MEYNGIRIHGAIALKGTDTEIHNLEVEQLIIDPSSENLNTLWYNSALSRLSYSELCNYLPAIRRIANDVDITNLTNLINSTAISIINAANTSKWCNFT